MPNKEMYVPKRGVTLTKIQLASQAIKEENKRRKKHNIKARKAFRAGKKAEALLPIIQIAAVPTARKTPDDMHGVKGMDSIVHSNKRLCGRLGALCDALRGAGLPLPWAENR